MKETIIVEGMHCEACKMLIKMELEENGFGNSVENIVLGENNTGTISINSTQTEELSKIENIINNLEGYKVIK